MSGEENGNNNSHQNNGNSPFLAATGLPTNNAWSPRSIQQQIIQQGISGSTNNNNSSKKNVDTTTSLNSPVSDEELSIYPPDVNGLISWLRERKKFGSSYLQQQYEKSEAGQKVEQVDNICHCLRNQLRSTLRERERALSAAEQQQNNEQEELELEAKYKKLIQRDLNKYKICVAKYSCMDRWVRYSTCFQYLDPKLIQEAKESRSADLLCKVERSALERCAGRVVSNAVETTTSIDDRNFFDNNNNDDSYPNY